MAKTKTLKYTIRFAFRGTAMSYVFGAKTLRAISPKWRRTTTGNELACIAAMAFTVSQYKGKANEGLYAGRIEMPSIATITETQTGCVIGEWRAGMFQAMPEARYFPEVL